MSSKTYNGRPFGPNAGTIFDVEPTAWIAFVLQQELSLDCNLPQWGPSFQLGDSLEHISYIRVISPSVRSGNMVDITDLALLNLWLGDTFLHEKL